MGMPLATFEGYVVESLLMTADEVRQFIDGLTTKPVDGEQLARELVKQKKLTAYQAKAIFQGKGKNLVLGNYRILDKLGEGGMGMVFKAEHTRMERVVALKVLSSKVVKEPGAMQRFMREVKAAARLSHPNIVAAYDSDEVRGQPFLVMEYVEGIDLASQVRQHGRLPVDKALNCVLQAAKGLEYAHEQHVIHRDIKPSNLLLDRKGNVKVLDMGLARLEHELFEQTELTGSGTMMGTIDYMSPEQATDTKHADARSDIYSLGCTLFFLLTARQVYAGQTMVSKIMSHRDAPIPSLREQRSEVPEVVEDLFCKMVAKKPADRPGSMTEVVAALERCTSLVGTGAALKVGSSEDFELDELVNSAGETPAPREHPGFAETIARKGGALEETAAWQGKAGSGDPRLTDAPGPARQTAPTGRSRWMAVASGAALVLVGVAVALVFLSTRQPGGNETELAQNDPLPKQTSSGPPAPPPTATPAIETADSRGTAGAEPQPPVAATNSASAAPMPPVAAETKSAEGASPGSTQPASIEAATGLATARPTENLTQGHRGTETPAGGQPVDERGTAGAEPKATTAQAPNADAKAVAESPPETKPKPTSGLPSLAKAPFTAEEALAHQEAWAEYLKIPVEHTNSIGMKFRLIPPGEFMMGCTPEQFDVLNTAAGSSYLPHLLKQQSVTVQQPYYLSQYEVTQQAYATVVGKNPAGFFRSGASAAKVAGLDTAGFPVESVSWTDAIEFCLRLSQAERLGATYARQGDTTRSLAGNGYRLPMEVEWEYACRAGTTTNFSIEDNKIAVVSWYNANSDGRPHVVGEKVANPFGLFDMHGNVIEWTNDAVWTASGSNWTPQFVHQGRVWNPSNSLRVGRGGNYGSSANPAAWSACRFSYDEKVHSPAIGFRVALSVDAVRPGRLALAAKALPEAKASMSAAKGTAKKGVEPGSASQAPVQLRVAELVLRNGGSIRVENLDAKYHIDIAKIEEIPLEPFLIESVTLSNRKEVAGDLLSLLKELPYLRSLTLTDTDVGDQALEQLPSFDGLQVLGLGGTKVTDASAGWIASHSDLYLLNLRSTQLKGEALQAIKTLRRLRDLNLYATAMTDAGLKELTGHPTLRTLALVDNKAVTYAGIAQLQTVPWLQELHLSGTLLGDEVVEILAKFPRLKLVTLTNSKVTSEGAIRLQAALPRATVLHPAVALDADLRAEQWIQGQKGTASRISGARVIGTVSFGEGVPGGAENLAGLRGITSLNWPNLQNADREVESIAKLESLRTLAIFGTTDLSDAGLRRLTTLKQLELLSVQSPKLTDAGFRQLPAFDNVTDLGLTNTAISDSGLASVGRMPNLRDALHLRYCKKISSEGIKHLTGLTELRRLDLKNTNINDAAVVHLRKMTGLRVLHLEETNITPAGIAALSQALPKCAIFYTGGAIVPGWTGYTPFAAPQAGAKVKTQAKKPRGTVKGKP